MSLIQTDIAMTAEERADLIARYIQPNPHRPGIAHFVVRDEWISVWALVAYYETVQGNIAQVTHDYTIDPRYVRAALAFYAEHTEEIDAFLRIQMTR